MGIHAPQSPADSFLSHLQFSLVAHQADSPELAISNTSATSSNNSVPWVTHWEVLMCSQESCRLGWGSSTGLSQCSSCSTKSHLLWKRMGMSQARAAHQSNPAPTISGEGAGPVSPLCSDSFTQGLEGLCALPLWHCVFVLSLPNGLLISEVSLCLRDLIALGFPQRGQCYFCGLCTQ